MTDIVKTGRPLDEEGTPTDGPALLLDPTSRVVDLVRESPHPLISSPGAGTWAMLLGEGDDRTGPELLQWLEPDATEPPVHTHPRPERFEVLDGALTVVVDGERQHLGPGETVTVPVGQAHTFRNETDAVVAFRAVLSSMQTVHGLFSVWGRDHEGAFGDDGGYGEPGLVHALLIAEALRGDTTMQTVPLAVQRVLWATVCPVARALGYRGVDERFLEDEFWRTAVEQPDL